VLKQVHERMVKIAHDKGVTAGRRMRVDTTVVETDIHHPTDSTLLGDGVRVLTCIMRKITKIVGAAGTKLRDRSRSVKFRLLEIGRVARAKGPVNQDKLQRRYGQLLDATSRVVGQAKRFSEEIARGVKRSTSALKQLALEGLRQELDEMTSRVRQVMKQTRARIFRGNTRSEGKLLSLFEPSTEVIRKGKAGKPNEFGKLVKLQEAENQIVTDYEVYARRPYDSGPAGRSHREASGVAGTHATFGGGRCCILLQAAGEAARPNRTLHPDPSAKASGRPAMDSRDQARQLPADRPQAGWPGASFHPQRLRLVRPLSAHWRGCGGLAPAFPTIDGEAVWCDSDGLAIFDRLHSRAHDGEVSLYAFDLLEGPSGRSKMRHFFALPPCPLL
jgi:IS5 family transposase